MLTSVRFQYKQWLPLRDFNTSNPYFCQIIQYKQYLHTSTRELELLLLPDNLTQAMFITFG